MTQGRHTPGTWSVHKSQTSNTYLVLADDDLIVAADITNKADADLLAASKVMYEVLKNILNGVDTGAITSEHDETFANAVKQARDAIAKTEGV